jgi:hypothetical protein
MFRKEWGWVEERIILKSSKILGILPQSREIVLGLKLLKESYRIKQQIDRLFILIGVCCSLIKISLSQNSSGDSAIFLLFYQNWFMQIWNVDQNPELLSSDAELRELILLKQYREEITSSLIEAALLVLPPQPKLKGQKESENLKYKNMEMHNWIKIAFQVADVCFKVLDWNTVRNIAPQSYLLFLEQISFILYNPNFKINPEQQSQVLTHFFFLLFDFKA